MDEKVPVMVSFGNPDGIRSFKFCEVGSSDKIAELVPRFGPEGWCSPNNEVSVNWTFEFSKY